MPMDVARRRACVKAVTVSISGCGVAVRTPTPSGTWARSTSEPVTMLPSLESSASPSRYRMTTSACVPRRTGRPYCLSFGRCIFIRALTGCGLISTCPFDRVSPRALVFVAKTVVGMLEVEFAATKNSMNSSPAAAIAW
jgi:hypothetical protein